ncbi:MULTISPECIES: cysteine rich repeat-containing protein [unclassified Xanthobacter]|uniref:cysteine rich repeat-containing protein n=1 Tax=unclassified Xanthobacter TaxID=2623496 RepID=UPI001EDD0087|nr:MULTISPECIES: cysteine rich repeat-containing protein [unclassified Xanthobacter]
MIRTSFILFAVSGTLLATPALAQSIAELQKACGADIKALCAGVQPGGGRIKQCIMEKSDQISPACKTALATAAQARANAKQ